MANQLLGYSAMQTNRIEARYHSRLHGLRWQGRVSALPQDISRHEACPYNQIAVSGRG